jgi:hypothetical protein
MRPGKQKKKSPQKATEWSVIKKKNSLKESRLSWFHLIDKKHLEIYVKFDGGLSILFAKN